MAKAKKDDDPKLFAFLGVLLTVIGFVIVYAAKKDDHYAMHYAKQGLVLFLGCVAVWMIGFVPFLGWIAASVGWILLAVLWIIGMIFALSGEEKQIPIIGPLAEMIHL